MKGAPSPSMHCCVIVAEVAARCLQQSTTRRRSRRCSEQLGFPPSYRNWRRHVGRRMWPLRSGCGRDWQGRVGRCAAEV